MSAKDDLKTSLTTFFSSKKDTLSDGVDELANIVETFVHKAQDSLGNKVTGFQKSAFKTPLTSLPLNGSESGAASAFVSAFSAGLAGATLETLNAPTPTTIVSTNIVTTPVAASFTAVLQTRSSTPSAAATEWADAIENAVKGSTTKLLGTDSVTGAPVDLDGSLSFV